jgi:nucleoside-diphosphate-sugar epimerase
MARKLFIAGSTGVVGHEVVRLCGERGVEYVAHARPKPGRQPPPRSAVLELSDAAALVDAMKGCTTVLQLIGTMRSRFGQGDTYETSDIGTTRQLVEAAKGAGVDHVVLLSSTGAGRPMGAYLKAKARAEALVREGGIPFTVLRPSAFTGTEERKVPGLMRVATRALGLRKLEPIEVADLARALLDVAARRDPLNAVLEGESLWDVVARAKAG